MHKHCSNCAGNFNPHFRIRTVVYGEIVELCTPECSVEIRQRWAAKRKATLWTKLVQICTIIMM